MHETELQPIDDPRARWLADALLEHEDCAAFRELERLRGICRSSAAIHDHFKHQRSHTDHVNQGDTDWAWLSVMFRSIHAMNGANNYFVKAARLLDIGCCPGGYATFVLRACPEVTGMGISLPVEDGGHGAAIPQDLLPRIDLRMMDITRIDLAPGPLKSSANPLSPIPFTHNSFDFIVADAQHVRHNPDNIFRPWNKTRLLISQILLALRAVYPGGTIFLRLDHVEHALTARILLAFCNISGFTHAIKSKFIHQTRGLFYLLAKGVRVNSSEYRKLVSQLSWLWCTMSFGGENGYGRDIVWEEWDLVTPWQEEVMTPHGVKQIAQLGHPIWEIQAEALRRFLTNKEIANNPN